MAWFKASSTGNYPSPYIKPFCPLLLLLLLLLRKILNESPFLAVMASRADGIQEIANMEKLISLTSDFMKEGYRTLYDFVNYLKLSIEQKDDEPQASITEESDAVKIMTLHQSKGLEYPVIILYKCNETTRKYQKRSSPRPKSGPT